MEYKNTKEELVMQLLNILRLRLIILLKKESRYDEVVIELKKLIKKWPERSGDLYFDLGNMFLKNKKFEEAIKCYDEAVLINPKDADAFCNMGSAYYFLWEKEMARIFFYKALSIKPNHEQAKKNISLLSKKIRFDFEHENFSGFGYGYIL